MFWQSLKINLETTCCILYSIKLMKACWKDILQKKKKVSPLWTSRHNLTRRRNRRTFGRGGGLGRMVFRGDEDGIGRRKQNVKRNYTGNWQPINSQWGESQECYRSLRGDRVNFPYKIPLTLHSLIMTRHLTWVFLVNQRLQMKRYHSYQLHVLSS